MLNELDAMKLMQDDPWAWMDILNKDKFMLSSLVMGLVALVNAAFPVVFWFTYLEDHGNVLGLTYSVVKNYHRAWRTIWLGNLIAYGPAALMWIPSYFSKAAAGIYAGTWTWAQRGSQLQSLVTLTLFVTEALYVGRGNKATEHVWISVVVYLASLALTMGLLDAHGEAAFVYYSWDKLEKVRYWEDNAGDFNELDDDADTLSASVFVF